MTTQTFQSATVDRATLTCAGLVVLVVLTDQNRKNLGTFQRALAETTETKNVVVSLVPQEFSVSEAGLLCRELTDAHPELPVCTVFAPTGLEAASFAGAMRDALSRFPTYDVAVLALQSALPYAWDRRLQKAAYAHEDIAASCAMCDASPIHALLEREYRESTQTNPIEIDRIVYLLGDRSFYEVPRLHPYCCYLKNAMVQSTVEQLATGLCSPQQWLDAFTQASNRMGKTCVICDYVYVEATQMLNAEDRVPSALEFSAYQQHHPLGVVRRNVMGAVRSGLTVTSLPGLDSKPVCLHIMHFWGGGIEKWVHDFANKDCSRTHLILATFRIGETGGQRVVLYANPGGVYPIRTWDISLPIRSTATRSFEYERILQQVIREFDVETMIVSSLIGHSLEALSQPIPTLVVCHDYYPICQVINPQFGGTCTACTAEDLARCTKSNPLNTIFTDQTPATWHEMRSRYVELLVRYQRSVFVPSLSVKETLIKLDSRFAHIDISTIPHGIDSSFHPQPYPARAPRERMRLIVLGRLSKHKGSDLLRAASAQLGEMADVTLVGCGKNGIRLANDCGWQYIEKYEFSELERIVREISPHAAILASVIPETFSYTLSELNQLAVPALATRLGSFIDRIVHGENGFLFAPDADSLMACAKDAHENPSQLEAVSRRLADKGRGRSVADMVHDYSDFLPAGERSIARFEVGIGQQTGLSAPYQQLSDAYAQTLAAYQQMERAYQASQTHFNELRHIWQVWDGEYSKLNPRRNWSQIPEALARVDALGPKLRAAIASAELSPPPNEDDSPWAIY